MNENEKFVNENEDSVSDNEYSADENKDRGAEASENGGAANAGGRGNGFLAKLRSVFSKKKKSDNTDDDAKSQGKKKLSALFSSNWFIAGVLVFSVIVIAAIGISITMATTGQTLGEVLFGIEVKRIDYLNDSLDKYVDPQSEDYKNIELELNIPKPTQADLREFIIGKLAKGAKDAGKNSIEYQTTTPISAGDRIYFYYAAYLKDENGNRIAELDGLNNCADFGKTSSQPKTFVVGSGDFEFLDSIGYDLDSNVNSVYAGKHIRGFENGLIGVVPNPTEFSFYTGGDVDADDIVYATATYIDDAGIIHDGVNVRIDLKDESYKKIWGDGVYEYIIEGHQIGDEMIVYDYETLTCADTGKKITYTSFVVNYVAGSSKPSAVLETTFPYDHPDKSLQNAKVYFDVFILKTEDYATPEFDDAFVSEYLKLSDKELAGYEGATLTEKCEAYYLAGLNEEYEYNRSLLAEELLWEKLKENIEFKQIPIREINYEYQDYVFFKELELQYENEYKQAGFEDIDDYMEAELGLEVGGDWENIVYSMLEDEVIEKLIFYSILKKENKLANGAEFESFCRAELEMEYKRETGKTAADFESAEKYNEELQTLRADFVRQSGGEAQFIEQMYYRYGSKILLSYATLKDVA